MAGGFGVAGEVGPKYFIEIIIINNKLIIYILLVNMVPFFIFSKKRNLEISIL